MAICYIDTKRMGKPMARLLILNGKFNLEIVHFCTGYFYLGRKLMGVCNFSSLHSIDCGIVVILIDQSHQKFIQIGGRSPGIQILDWF